MVPARKSKLVTASAKYRLNSITRRRQPGGLVCLLGSKWSEDELVHFYEAYRKFGKDWVKVAAAVGHGRTKEMVETLHSMNETYLSLPEGEEAATLGGFISHMTDRYDYFLGEDPTEEQDPSANFVAKDGNIVRKTVPESNRRSKEGDSSQVSQTYFRRARRIKIKFNGKVCGTTVQEHADAIEMKRGSEVRSDAIELFDEDPEVLQKRLFGEDERISNACKALLLLSRGKPLKTAETGESSEQVKERNTAMAVDDKSSLPEAAEQHCLGDNANDFSRAEKLPQRARRPAEDCMEPLADLAQMIDSAVSSSRRNSRQLRGQKARRGSSSQNDERISNASEALLLLSRGEPPKTAETGESSEQVTERNTAMAVDDKSCLPEAAEQHSLGDNVNDFSRAEELPQRARRPVEVS
ncbi:protein ALWAYS EARLY 2-like [Punica granatum]|uniref:Protein ALWAYS EARLY 2-like n=1 Tax=Punica granatum TaxID=22663 RepID=A0A6P8E6M8_PUNGR|nr:protein ALWAYS EARLY 2-like [Punica granatum]